MTLRPNWSATTRPEQGAADAALREELRLTGEQLAEAIRQVQTEVLIGAHGSGDRQVN
jgi:hypothetical protein